jgi:hypothetical protein
MLKDMEKLLRNLNGVSCYMNFTTQENGVNQMKKSNNMIMMMVLMISIQPQNQNFMEKEVRSYNSKSKKLMKIRPDKVGPCPNSKEDFKKLIMEEGDNQQVLTQY